MFVANSDRFHLRFLGLIHCAASASEFTVISSTNILMALEKTGSQISQTKEQPFNVFNKISFICLTICVRCQHPLCAEPFDSYVCTLLTEPKRCSFFSFTWNHDIVATFDRADFRPCFAHYTLHKERFTKHRSSCRVFSDLRHARINSPFHCRDST